MLASGTLLPSCRSPRQVGSASPQRHLADTEQKAPNGGSVASSLLASVVPRTLRGLVVGVRLGGHSEPGEP